MDMGRSSLRWDLLAPDGMLIILRAKNMTPRVIAHRSQQTISPVKKARSATIFKKRDLAAKDPIYIEMRKSWRASE